MLKMRDVYAQNPSLGDPSTLDKQLEENAQKLDKLKEEIKKFEVRLQVLSSVDLRFDISNVLSRTTWLKWTTRTRLPVRGPSLAACQTWPLGATTVNKAAPLPARLTTQGTSKYAFVIHCSIGSRTQYFVYSPQTTETDSGVDVGQQRHSNVPMADQDSFDELDDDFPAIGTCKALYNFDGQSSGLS